MEPANAGVSSHRVDRRSYVAGAATRGRMYDAVVFDNDGVLTTMTDWERIREAVRQTCEEFDVEPTRSLVDRLVGVTPSDVEAVCAELGVDADAFWERRDHNAAAVQIEEIRAGRKRLYPEVRSTIDALECPAAVVSNNQQRTVDFIVDHFELDRLDPVYGRQPTLLDLERKKPNPHYLRLVLADLEADRALYVGDSPKDVVAAERAGMDSLFLRRPHRRDATLSAEPTYEATDLEGLAHALAGRSSP